MHTLGDEGLQNSATWVFHLAQKAGVISTGKCIAPWVSNYTSFRAEFQCHVYSMNSSKYKEPETKEILKQLSATNISEQAKGKEKHFLLSENLFPFMKAFSYQEMNFWKQISSPGYQALPVLLFYKINGSAQSEGYICSCCTVLTKNVLEGKKLGQFCLLYWSLILQNLRWNIMTIHQKS